MHTVNKDNAIKLYFNGDNKKPVRQKYLDRITESVEVSDRCLVWQYPTRAKAPQISLTYGNNHSEVVAVARLLFQEKYPQVEYSSNIHVRRICNTPNCVNPDCHEILIKESK